LPPEGFRASHREANEFEGRIIKPPLALGIGVKTAIPNALRRLTIDVRATIYSPMLSTSAPWA
jgi:hypothetical protein